MGLETGTYLQDLNIANPVGAADLLAQGDDHIRLIKTTLKNTFPNMTGAAWRVQNKGTNYTLAATDNMSVIRATATITLATEAAATVGNGFIALVVGDGGDAVIDPNGAETINGSATLTVLNNSAVVVYCNGSLFYALQLMIPNGVGLYLPAGQSITFEGTTADAYETVLAAGEPTADRIATLPDQSGVVVLQARGADIASGATVNLATATGDIVDVTGTTTITAITLTDGIQKSVRFTGALTLTNGASLVLPGATDIVTDAGDIAVFRGYAAGVVRCTSYQRVSGVAVVVNAVFSQSFQSAEQTISAFGGLTLAHGLTVAPKTVQCILKCTDAGGDVGYSQNDEVYVHPMWTNWPGSGSYSCGFSLWCDATNIGVRYGEYIGGQNKTTGAQAFIAMSKWKLIVRAYA